MKILVIDIGGTNVKILASGQSDRRKFPSGPTLTPQQMVDGVLKAAEGWEYDAISIGIPAPVLHGRPISEPANLGRGWVGFNFETAFKRPVKLVNDAAMQALGSYEGGCMLFLGLGTGVGSAMVVNGVVEPAELAHLPYRKRTYEGYLGLRGLKRLGHKKWERYVNDIVTRLRAALEPDYIVLGGGNVKELTALPPGTRPGNNANAFLGGFRLWGEAAVPPATPAASPAQSRNEQAAPAKDPAGNP
jgi:polyphosphate glucokinase